MRVPQAGQRVHISHSQVEEYLQCPKRYYLHRIERLPPDFMPSGLLFGTAIHEAIACYHQGRLEGKVASPEEMHVTFETAWASQHLPVRYSRGESGQSLSALARSLLRAFLAHPHHAGDVLAVEEPFALELSTSLPPVHGRIDLVESASEGALGVTDFKTSKGNTEPEPEQLVLYREAVRALGYPGADHVSARFVVLVKTQEPEIVVYTPEIGPDHLPRLIRRYEEAWQAIQSERAFYARPDSWCRGCQWQRHCDAYTPR
jgi:putative RecB family exonuclease